MKASELIAELQKAIELEGDLEVFYDSGACRVRSLIFVEKQDDWPGTPFFELEHI